METIPAVLHTLFNSDRGDGGRRTKDTALRSPGTEAIDVFNSFQLIVGGQKAYDVVLRKFEQFCTPKRNERYERYVFNSRNQAKSESVEEFITDLKSKCQSCNFGELADSLLL